MSTAEMKMADPSMTRVVKESEIYESLLPLDSAHIVELGCGSAAHTRAIAETGRPASILACEVDTIQHEKNLSITDLPIVDFVHAGAQAIPAVDQSVDIVMMFKSLHHVPMELMDAALNEINRVLKPGGLAYISEPVFAGNFNEVLRIFHDEEAVREAAFNTVKRAVQTGVLNLSGQHFFNVENNFENFEDFEQKVIGVSHTEHTLTDKQYQQVKEKFESFMGPEGAKFTMPIRVDLLTK